MIVDALSQARAMRFRCIERAIPRRVLNFLRKSFDTLILAYSGGTDSTLLLLICKMMELPLDKIVFGNTRLEYSETLAYVHRTVNSLGYSSIFTEIFPEMSVAELARIVLEDFDKNLYRADYDKSAYRCCYHAKEKPMRVFLKESGLDNEHTCILRGVRLVDNSNRMLSGLTLIGAGHFYYYDYKHADEAACGNPLWLMSDDGKNRWLPALCDKFNVPMPDKSGCSICPIYYRYARGRERESLRFKIAQRFIETRSTQKLPHYLGAEVHLK